MKTFAIFRPEFSDPELIEAAYSVVAPSGALIFESEERELVRVYAAGHWKICDGPLPATHVDAPAPTSAVDHGCGHGHVYPSQDGSVAKCGGPGICEPCSKDFVRFVKAMPPETATDDMIRQAIQAMRQGTPTGPDPHADGYNVAAETDPLRKAAHLLADWLATYLLLDFNRSCTAKALQGDMSGLPKNDVETLRWLRQQVERDPGTTLNAWTFDLMQRLENQLS